jgi:uncharacterized coiled-coil protein SlyX
MTQTQPDRLDQLEAVIERVDRKLDTIATDLGELKLESRVYHAQTSEKLDSLTQRVGSLEEKVKAQDNRLWSFVTALILALVGLLAKLAFFPQA